MSTRPRRESPDCFLMEGDTDGPQLWCGWGWGTPNAGPSPPGQELRSNNTRSPGEARCPQRAWNWLLCPAQVQGRQKIPVPRGGAAAQSWLVVGLGARVEQEHGTASSGIKGYRGDGDTTTWDSDGDIPLQQAAPGCPKPRRNYGLSSGAASQGQDAGTA